MVTSIEIEAIEDELALDGFTAPYGTDAAIRFLTRHQIFADKMTGTMTVPIFDESVYLATCPSQTKAGEYHMIVIAVNHGACQVLDPGQDPESECIYSFGGNVEGMIPCFEYFKLNDCSLK